VPKSKTKSSSKPKQQTAKKTKVIRNTKIPKQRLNDLLISLLFNVPYFK
jgi:hypothetical protein